MKNYNKLRIVLIVLMTISIILSAFMTLRHYNQEKKEEEKSKETDRIKFSEEYPFISKDNMFKYRTLKEANNLIENGSGYFFFCNIENANCSKYAMYLHDEAEEEALETIYYVDIKEDMEKETKEYKRFKELTKNKLEKIEYPLSLVVNKKEIIGTNIVTDPSYWTTENIEKFRIEIMEYMLKLSNNICDDECND